MEEIKKREIFSPNYGKKMRIKNPDEEIRDLRKSASMYEIQLNTIKNGVNKQALYNDRILKEINQIRKDKLIQRNKLTKIKEENDEISQQIQILTRKNKRSISKLHFDDLKKS